MDNFTFYAPTYFDFGKGAEAHVGQLIRRFGSPVSSIGLISSSAIFGG